MALECGQIRIYQNLHLLVWSYPCLFFLLLFVCVHIQEIPLRIPAVWNNVLLEASREGEREAREGYKYGARDREVGLGKSCCPYVLPLSVYHSIGCSFLSLSNFMMILALKRSNSKIFSSLS